MIVVVDNRIRLHGELPPEIVAALKRDFEHANPEYGLKKAIGITVWNVPRAIATWRLEGGELTLPRGGMARLRHRLADRGVRYRVEDRRSEGVPCRRFPSYVGHELRGYQAAGIEAALAREQCILRAPTGSGKTSMAFALLSRIGLNALVILPTGGLMRQWQDRAAVELGVRGDALGIVQGPKRRLRPLTIASQQTLARGVSDEVKEFFGAVLIDECQLAAARTYVEVVDALPCRYRIAVSADERRKDRKEFLTRDLFGDIAHEVKRDELEKTGHVVDVEIRVVPTSFRADWYGVSQGADDEREVDFVRLVNEMVADKARTELALRHLRDEVRAGEQAIVLTGRREQVTELGAHFAAHNVAVGNLLGKQEEGDAREFERARLGILDGSVRVGIGTYQALGFGIDLPAVAVGAALTPIASNPQVFNQVRGRLCRPSPGKRGGRLYYLLDELVYPGHLAMLVSKNRNVVVWHRGAWVPAADYLRKARRRAV